MQNEPEAKQTWDSCLYTAEEERDFIKYYLGPSLERHNLLDKKVIIWDHNRDMMVERARTVLKDPEAAKKREKAIQCALLYLRNCENPKNSS